MGNGFLCTSCYSQEGTQPNAVPWVGIRSRLPQYRNRTRYDIHLEERINDCFVRSMNGIPLGPESEAMVSLVAYMDWLSTDYPVGAAVAGLGIPHLDLGRAPDSTRGERLYLQKM